MCFGFPIEFRKKAIYLQLVFVVTLKGVFRLVCLLFSVISETDDRSYSLLLDVPLVVYSGRWAVNCSRACYTGFRMRHNRSCGGTAFSQKGVQDKCSRFWGVYPRTFWSKGGLGCSLLRRGSVSPNTVPEKEKTKVCVLGMGCGHHGSVSELNSEPFGASASTFRGCFFSVPPNDRISRGFTPLRPFPKIESVIVCILKKNMTTTSGVSSTILGPTLIFASFVIHRSSVFSKCHESKPNN